MPKKYEKSSGGIIYRKDGNNIDILLLKWLNSRGSQEYVIPKGHMEGDETASQTALRETAEETGLNIKELEIIKFITKLNYTFTAGYLKNNPVIDKDVYLFLIKYNGQELPNVQKEERFTGYEWVNISDIKKYQIKFNLAGIVSKNRTYFI